MVEEKKDLDNELSFDCKKLVLECLKFKRFRFFPLFSEEDVKKHQSSSDRLIQRLNSALLRRLTDQQGGSIGIFRDIHDNELIEVLKRIWTFLNKIVQFFLINNNLINESYNDFILEDKNAFTNLLVFFDENQLDEKIELQFKYFYKAFSFFEVNITGKYGDKIWICLNDAVKILNQNQKEILINSINHKSFKELKSIYVTFNPETLSEEKKNEQIIKNTISIIQKAQKSIGGSKAFIIFKSLCFNAKIISKNPLFLFNTIKKCFLNIPFKEENLIENATKVQDGIKLFLKELNKNGIQQVGEKIGPYYLRDLVTEKNHLDIDLKINGKKERFNTKFARYCFKRDSNATKFLILSGLILLPSLYKDIITKQINDASLNKKAQDTYEQCLNFIEHIKKKFTKGNINWYTLIVESKKDFDYYSDKYETHVLVKIALNSLFNKKITEERKYIENFGLLNEIFYLKCQSQCNISSQYLCWNSFEPHVLDEKSPIYSFCNVAQYCLLTKIDKSKVLPKEKSKINEELKEFLNRLKTPYKKHLKTLINELNLKPIKIYWASLHFKNENKKLIITAYTKNKLEFVFSRSKKENIKALLKILRITSIHVKDKADNESYGKKTTPAIDFKANVHEYEEFKKICVKWLEI